MKILLVHNFYGSSSPSGENITVNIEVGALKARGHDVHVFFDYSDRISSGGFFSKISVGMSVPWSIKKLYEFRSCVESFKPDVIHVHNTFPLISPSIFYSVKNIPFVLTLHNYRLFCPAAIPMRNNSVCTDCFEKLIPFPSLKHRCYRNSMLATFPIFMNVSLHKLLGTWNRRVSRFIVFSDFQKRIVVDSGIDENKIYIKPNYHPDEPSVTSWRDRDDSFVFLGRLSSEKGIDTLISAWTIMGSEAPTLHVIGHGPFFSKLVESSINSNIRVHGFLDDQQKENILSSCKALLVPSNWFEGQPASLVEGMARGLAIGVSDVGPLPSFVDYGDSGFVFKAGDAKSLADSVLYFSRNDDLLRKLASAGREKFINNYTKDVSLKRLENLYASLIN